jgi:adenosyl cobinamide kinase/adenosyl cobinamide phosphate guanylyltransferase
MSKYKAEIVFVLGGARSGKSRFALELARRRGGDNVLFIATAEALDEEMRRRIAEHRQERPPAWQTLEAPRELIERLRHWETMPRLIVVDCLTLWVSNELLANEVDLETRVACELDILSEWVRLQDIDLILISNEVGLGIVPDNALSRTFRDVLGRINARAAAHADRVFWMVAGLPIEVKSRAYPSA